MTYYSPGKIYGAQPPGPADQASTLSGPAATAGSGFTASFEFANPADNLPAPSPWAASSQQPPLSALNLPQPGNEDPWSELRMRGGRTHSFDGSTMPHQVPQYVSGALSECGTLVSRHAVSDSAYVSGASGSRLSSNLINSTRSKADKVASRNAPPARLPFVCELKDCDKSFKCKSDHRYVASPPSGRC
jgi:hypothetical protein